MVPSSFPRNLKSFLQTQGVEHRKTRPLWPQANGEVERQNRSLLKNLQIANLEGKNWRTELVTWLAAYRSTPQTTTGATPFFLMFGREMRSKLPELRGETVQVPREEVRDRDWSNKLKGKAYADARRGAAPKSVRVGDAVLLKGEKSSKLSTNFRPSPFKVVEKTGSEVTVRNEAGEEFKRNTAFVKRNFEKGKKANLLGLHEVPPFCQDPVEHLDCHETAAELAASRLYISFAKAIRRKTILRKCVIVWQE
ncbi:hypothetical protein ACROYT_G024621 [Oculina patagonica]